MTALLGAKPKRPGSAYAWCLGETSFAEFDAQVQGWIAHVQQADTLGLRAQLLGRFALQGRSLKR